MGAPPPALERLARDERGSVLLMSIMLVFVMTLLGLALFDLGAIENRMSLASQADLRAFEVDKVDARFDPQRPQSVGFSHDAETDRDLVDAIAVGTRIESTRKVGVGHESVFEENLACVHNNRTGGNARPRDRAFE